jgi:putative NADH-flavin reductase
MEKNILNKKSGYKFTAVERDKETYQKMIKNLIKDDGLFNSVIATANKSIGEVVMNDTEDTYSSAILDYCGFIDSFYEEIDDIMKRNLVKKGGNITITLAENDRVINHSLQMNNYTNRYISKCYPNEVVSGEKITKELINNLVFNNAGYKITTKFNYRDTKVNMLLFIIHRIDQ